MKITQADFIRICVDHGIMAAPETLKDVLRALKVLEKSKKGERTGTHVDELVKAYYDEILEVHGRKAVMLEPDYKLAASVVSGLGLEKSIQLVKTYVRMKSSYFLQRGHDFRTFYYSISTVQQALETGKILTQIQAREEERDSVNTDAIKEYIKGKYSGST